MMPVRSLLAGACAIAFAAPAVASCLQPAERTALDVRALQSHLMVVAIACKQEDSYNAFVRRFQGDLGGAFRTVQTHFRRAHGRQGQKELDNYITVLANAQSQDGVRAGSFFCRDNQPLFQQAMALSSPDDLARFAIERNLSNPYDAPTCTETTPTRATPQRSRTRTRRAEATPARATRTASAATASR